MNTEKLIYWRRLAEVVVMLAALMVTLFWKSAPVGLAAAIQALALSLGQSPLGNPVTTRKTIAPAALPVVDVLRIPTIPSPPPDMMIPPPHPEEPGHE